MSSYENYKRGFYSPPQRSYTGMVVGGTLHGQLLLSETPMYRVPRKSKDAAPWYRDFDKSAHPSNEVMRTDDYRFDAEYNIWWLISAYTSVHDALERNGIKVREHRVATPSPKRGEQTNSYPNGGHNTIPPAWFFADYGVQRDAPLQEDADPEAAADDEA